MRRRKRTGNQDTNGKTPILENREKELSIEEKFELVLKDQEKTIALSLILDELLSKQKNAGDDDE